MTVGSAKFSVTSGRLLSLGQLKITNGAKLDIWRAKTDNDRAFDATPGPHNGAGWEEAGLDRVHHRVDKVSIDGDLFVVRTFVAPAVTGRGFVTTYRWTARKDGSVKLDVQVNPSGDWSDISLPRLGIRLGLPKQLERVKYFGLGPGEACPDTRQAARIGLWDHTIDGMQTPYVYPQENGSRADVQWAEITGQSGDGLRIEGSPTFAITARRWTSEELHKTTHTTDLKAGNHVWVNIDQALGEIGTASSWTWRIGEVSTACEGDGVLHSTEANEVSFSMRLKVQSHLSDCMT